ncbi:hypothetical protein PR048_031813 [Dryococelus australis]|uniref:Reverse transcriptase Ty1/copia-type domain-containing protein n=1 Tax=Dryococelus australis TaxID=614101 RepID=A0ABQ9GAC0_9NEOP|nr:hypothetical protein PR048_031813 [Dryococelus australis]
MRFQEQMQKRLQTKLEVTDSTHEPILLDLDGLDCDEWLIDSGVSHHVTNRRDWYVTFSYFNVPKKMSCSRQGVKIDTVGSGRIYVKTFDGHSCCALGKHTRMSFGERVKKSKAPGELIFADICGPIEVNNINGHRYFLIFKDDFSSFRATYLLWKKDEVNNKLNYFVEMLKTQAQLIVKELQTDGDVKFEPHKLKIPLPRKSVAVSEKLEHASGEDFDATDNEEIRNQDDESTNEDEETCDDEDQIHEANLEEDIEDHHVEIRYFLRDRTGIRKPALYCAFSLFLEGEVPVNYEDDIKMLQIGRQEEMDSLLKNQTYGEREGLAYFDTFSPAARLETMRALIGCILKCDCVFKQFDVKTDFLNGTLEDDEYMRQPRGYEDKTGCLCKLPRSLYGLKQASECWYKCLTDFLKENGLKGSTADPFMFYSKNLIIFFHVDDGMILGSLKSVMDIIKILGSHFELTCSKVDYYLGLQIKTTANSIEINQSAYAEMALRKFGMEDYNPLSLPIEFGWTPGNSPLTENVENYREIVGNFNYLVAGTQPNLAYAVNVASRVQDKPTNTHSSLVKRILRYIKGTISDGIKFEKTNNKFIEAYGDADHKGEKNLSKIYQWHPNEVQ